MIEEIVRQEFEQQTPDDSAETLAARIVASVSGIPEESRDDVVALVAREIRQGPSAYSSVGSDYNEEAILDVSAEDVVACLERLCSAPEVDQWPDIIA